jgi:hypothetical protein
MLTDILIRFAVGGVVVSLFAVLGDPHLPSHSQPSFSQSQGKEALRVDGSPLHDPGRGRIPALCMLGNANSAHWQVAGPSGHGIGVADLGCRGHWFMGGNSAMKIQVNLSAVGQSRWYESLSRFVFGGIATALAGIVADKCGPVVGGLFLAFPAIFPATATLIDNHEKKRKQKTGGGGQVRGRKAAALDACGTEAGALGLMAFGAVVWKLIILVPLWATLLLAVLVWLAVSVGAWRISKAF